MACVGTWSFSQQALQVAVKLVEQGQDCINAVEAGINAVEDDPSTGPYYVGRGCYPNKKGLVQLDAAIMMGKDCAFGAVAGLERYSKPISVARKVLDHPMLSMVVGNGATEFAANCGFALEENTTLLSDKTMKAYKAYADGLSCENTTEGHDTLSVLCLDQNGCVAAGVSTSGPPFKFPGRVGDSPLPGCGLYADNSDSHLSLKAGAAAASGDGEKIMCFCPSFHIVELMRQGKSPQQACETVVKKIIENSGNDTEVAVIALDMKGNSGAASTVTKWLDFRDQKTYHGFPYTVWRIGQPITLTVQSAL